MSSCTSIKPAKSPDDHPRARLGSTSLASSRLLPILGWQRPTLRP